MATPIISNHIETTEIEGLLVVNRPIYTDDRGFFREVGRLHDISEVLGKPFEPVQINHSRSYPNVIRGLHAENWNKLVYPVTGTMFAAFVDLRPNSDTFMKVLTFTIDDNNRHSIFVSKGIANSICAISNEKEEAVDYIYFVDAYYDGKDTTALAWDDPELAIPWPVKNPILTEKDRQNPTLKDLYPNNL